MRYAITIDGRRPKKATTPFRTRPGKWRIISPDNKQIYTARCQKTKRNGGKSIIATFAVG